MTILNKRMVWIICWVPVLAACGVFGAEEPQEPQELVEIEVIHTATMDPDATDPVIFVTATPRPRADVTAVANAGNATSAETGDPVAVVTVLPENCLVYTIESGDTVFGVAAEFEVNPFVMLEVNDLAEDTLLNIGDELIVPLEGCPIDEIAPISNVEPTQTPTDEPALEAETTTIALPDIDATLGTSDGAPTATDEGPAPPAQTVEAPAVTIVEVSATGDVATESLLLTNVRGASVPLQGWVLRNSSGGEYQFPDVILFAGRSLILNSGVGQDLPTALHRGLDTPAYQLGDTLQLIDAEGRVQATFQIPQSQ